MSKTLIKLFSPALLKIEYFKCEEDLRTEGVIFIMKRIK